MIIACPDCAAVQVLSPPPRRGHVDCYRCGGILERRTSRSLDAALACATASLFMLFPANLLPLVLIRPPVGFSRVTYLGSGCAVLWDQGWPLIAVLLGLQGILLPFLRFGLLIAVLAAIRLRAQPRWVGRGFRYAEYLDLWAMPDVLLLGAVIGYGRVAAFIPVHVQAGGWCLIASAVLAMLTRATLDRRAVWRRISAPSDVVFDEPIACIACDLVLPAKTKNCPRCGLTLHRRKPFSVMRTNALLLTAFLLWPVANYFPASSLWEAGEINPHTIFDGIRLLFVHGYAPAGLLICCTSVGIPLVKLAGIAWCSICVSSGSRRALQLRTRLYRIIEAISRWSYVDPFTVIIFTPMVQFGSMAHITIGSGGPAFVAVIVISMIAARAFDPRLMWDVAGRIEAGR